ncbi:MAG: Fic family protein [Burkholderiaceae bacterium]|nr:Fic family protein [Burkholderiaceae bacterium]
MNSYYSNLIEGQGTHPLNIEAALRKDFSESPDTARRQRLAVAHIEAERELEHLLHQRTLSALPSAVPSVPDASQGPWTGAPAARRAETMMSEALRPGFLMAAHQALYSRLAPYDRTTDDGVVVEPGRIRTQEVSVGRHVPPAAEAIERFLTRLGEVYPPAAERSSWPLIAIAAAHQRAAWVHPFVDGNGRAVRLQTHCALFPLTGGLWSVSRALARQRDAYYAHLEAADAPRQGDLDGRGNLSERELVNWCGFLLALCVDQVRFMATMLDLDGFKKRLAVFMTARAAEKGPGATQYREALVLPMAHITALGPVTRGEFKQLTGLTERTAQASLAQLLSEGLLRSDSPKGPVKLGLPLSALSYLFPRLYPEAQAPLPTASSAA